MKREMEQKKKKIHNEKKQEKEAEYS